ncbi:hypothetical protein WKW77_34570 [Variovorax ureilyticus]|uniref:Uncharacterized protein n=1 Tax=Variovorax ureilyticus TaxID=1836198 RepID=A0ABU8VT37_9BURK
MARPDGLPEFPAGPLRPGQWLGHLRPFTCLGASALLDFQHMGDPEGFRVAAPGAAAPLAREFAEALVS